MSAPKTDQTFEEVTAERDALRGQIDALWAAWNKSTDWRGFGSDAYRILSEGQQ
jgi:hypothetical protein